MERPDPEWPCLAAGSDGVTLSLKVSPNASRTQVGGLWQNRLRLRVQAPPVEGKANEAIRDWAARAFGVRRQDVGIAHGERGSEKVLTIRGIGLEAAQAALTKILGPRPDLR